MAERFNYDNLFSATSRDAPPGSVRHSKYDFAVAYPDPDTLPLDELIGSLKSGFENEGRDLAYYSDGSGYPELRRLVAEKLARERNMKVQADDLVLTSGSGEAIGIVIQALTDPGDVVLTEEFVYLGTLNQMRRYGADIVGVKCDDDGIIPADLDSVITEQTAKGKKVKYLYTIPAFQNPMGWTMTLERRKQVLEITGKHGIPVFEDDCYADLRFEGEDVTSFHSLDDTGRVIYVGSFSKIIAPGMRMGYLVAPPEVINRAWSFKSGGAVSQFTALAVAEYMKGGLDQHIEAWTKTLGKYQLMELLQSHGVPTGPVQGMGDRIERDPQLRHRGLFEARSTHPILGDRIFEGMPMKMKHRPWELWRYGPTMGEDNGFVTQEILGRSQEEIEAMEEQHLFWPRMMQRQGVKA